MRVAILCEFSGTVRDSFIRRGHDAISCDLLPTEALGPHIQGDLREHDWSGYDLIIAHPPCTYLCGMGVWWNHKRPERWALTDQAEAFFRFVWSIPCERMAIENPIGVMSTRFRKPDQIIQPWQFGHEANKPTCLWTRGLPALVPTKIVDRGRFYTKKNGSRASVWSHQTSGRDKTKRAKIASTTFPGIAEAMADQWGAA
jgi:hypothetical protein